MEVKGFNILGNTLYPYELSLLGLAEYLHMLSNGSAGDITYAYQIWIPYQYIKLSLKNWRKNCSVYDEAVRMLLTAALHDIEISPLYDWETIKTQVKIEEEQNIINERRDKYLEYLKKL